MFTYLLVKQYYLIYHNIFLFKLFEFMTIIFSQRSVTNTVSFFKGTVMQLSQWWIKGVGAWGGEGAFCMVAPESTHQKGRGHECSLSPISGFMYILKLGFWHEHGILYCRYCFILANLRNRPRGSN